MYSRFNIPITKDQVVELKLPKYSISERELRWLCPELPFPQQPLTKYAKTGAKNVLKYTAKTASTSKLPNTIHSFVRASSVARIGTHCVKMAKNVKKEH